MTDLVALLRRHGIQPTPQRLAVADAVLRTDRHPTADQVWARVRRRWPTVSRATVYNALNLFADRQLLRPHVIKEGAVVFDARVARHHHFVDDETGRIYDVPWEAVTVSGERGLEGFDVREYEVIMRGRRREGA